MQESKKPAILWPQTLMLSLTFIAAISLVPWYGIVYGYDTFQWLMFFAFLWLNGLSITGGYHRLWSHNAYQAHPALKVFYALWGGGALQNSILAWASGHRRHHRHVDEPERDPYSAKRGLWFSHIGWMLRAHPSGDLDLSNSKDLQRDKVVMWQHRHYLKIVLFMNIVLPTLIGLWHGDLLGCLLLIGVLRLVVNHHVTFFINSLAHFWGKQPYSDENTARDNSLLALLTYGEGYHNYHHLFQTDYRNGVKWWHFDPTKWFIRTCSWLRLASRLNTVSNFKIQKALLSMQFKRAHAHLDKAHNADYWRDYVEHEYQEFLENLNEWSALRLQWCDKRRHDFAERKQELQHKWEKTALRTRFKELEYTLKMQQKRLNYLSLQIA